MYLIHQGEGPSNSKVSIVMPMYMSTKSSDQQYTGFLEQEQTLL